MAPLLLFLLLSSSVTAQLPVTDPFDLGPPRTTHLHFFFHDIRSGPNPTAVSIVTPSNTTAGVSMSFGSITMIDNLLTDTLSRTSNPVGRAQGFYGVSTQQGEFALLMTMNLVLTSGEFNGSSLTVVGRNNVLSGVRELPVLGGSGKFRMARGYALARTRWFNSLGDASVEYDVYVTHFSGTGKAGVSTEAAAAAGGREAKGALRVVATAIVCFCLIG